MNKREQVVVICLVLLVILTICGVSLWLSRRDNNPRVIEQAQATPTNASVPPTDDEIDSMKMLAIYGTQTAVALRHSTDLLPFDDEGGVTGELAMFGTQTAIVMNHTPVPTVTLMSNQAYWSPPAIDAFFPHFFYDASQWALTDLRTLASLRVRGCTLRVAGGRALGPGWSTEESSLQVHGHRFATVLATYETTPQFITYSLIESSMVFEIASPVSFEQCRDDGEVVLKTMLIP